MQIHAQDYLDFVEAANKIAFVDTEDTGLKGDYNSVLVVSVLPYMDKKAHSFVVVQPGNDQRVVREAKEDLAKYHCWVTYYGKGFDVPMLNTRLTKWGQGPLPARHHIDMYFSLKHNLLTARKSQAHLLRFFDCPVQKMDLSPEAWNEVLADPAKNLPTMTKRCESDAAGLRELYRKTRHLIKDIRCG